MTGREKLGKIVKSLGLGQKLDQTNLDIEWIWEKSSNYPQNSSTTDKGWDLLYSKLNHSVESKLFENSSPVNTKVNQLPEQGGNQHVLKNQNQSNFHFFRKAIAIAASVILIASSGIWFWNNYFQNNLFDNTFQTVAQQISSEELPDGSVVKLNAGSVLSFSDNFGKTNREIKFEGEAFFKVTGNEKLPFVISTGNSKIKVIGTAFNIDGQITGVKKISVVQGLVEVSLEGQIIGQFKKDEEVILDEINHTYTFGSITNTISWDNNVFHFENTKLSHVIEKLEKWYGVSFNYPAELADERVTSTFDKLSAEKAAEILSKTMVVDITVNK